MKPTLQSSLGSVRSNSINSDRVWSMGSLCLGEVLKVHNKRYTADVRLYGSSTTISSASSQEGVHSCRIGVSNAGFDPVFKKPYGEIIPIQKGSIVLVGFLNNSKKKPVILRVFHNISEDTGQHNNTNILSSTYTLADAIESNKYLNISRIQDFITVDGEGSFELSSHTKSFLVGINNKEIDEETFDYEDLSVKDINQTTVSVDEANSKPLKLLAVFRDHFLDTKTNWLRIIINPLKTAFKIAKVQQLVNALSELEIDCDGNIRMRRQLDKNTFSGSKNYSEILLDNQGNIKLRVKGESSSSIQLNKEGEISIDSDSDITIKSNRLTITGDVVIEGTITTPKNNKEV